MPMKESRVRACEGRGLKIDKKKRKTSKPRGLLIVFIFILESFKLFFEFVEMSVIVIFRLL